jgi:hypothetical protein
MSTAEKWAGHIRNCGQSGLSQAEYCRRNSLHPASFSCWKRRLKEDARDSGFVALALPAVSGLDSADDVFRAHLCNGIELVIPLHADRNLIAAIVSVLREL